GLGGEASRSQVPANPASPTTTESVSRPRPYTPPPTPFPLAVTRASRKRRAATPTLPLPLACKPEPVSLPAETPAMSLSSAAMSLTRSAQHFAITTPYMFSRVVTRATSTTPMPPIPSSKPETVPGPVTRQGWRSVCLPCGLHETPTPLSSPVIEWPLRSTLAPPSRTTPCATNGKVAVRAHVRSVVRTADSPAGTNCPQVAMSIADAEPPATIAKRAVTAPRGIARRCYIRRRRRGQSEPLTSDGSPGQVDAAARRPVPAGPFRPGGYPELPGDRGRAAGRPRRP